MDKKFIIKLLVFILLFLITPNVYASSANVYVSGYENYALVQEEINLINAERAKEGLEPLVLDEVLTEKAMIRAHEIAVSYSHTRPNGVKNFSIFDDINYTAGGENIAAGQGSPSEVMIAWMNSYDHMKNIMAKSSPASRFKAVGLGHFQVNGYNYWVQLFSDYVSSPLTRYDTAYYEGYIYVSFPDGENFNGFLYNYFNKTIDLNKNNTYAIFDSDPRVLYNYNVFSISRSEFTYWSENNDIAVVDGNGVITGVNFGVTTIHASYNNVDYTLVVNVIGNINKVVENNNVIFTNSEDVIPTEITVIDDNNKEEQEVNLLEHITVKDNDIIRNDFRRKFTNSENIIKALAKAENIKYISTNTNWYISDDDMIIIDENDGVVIFKTKGYMLVYSMDYIRRLILS